MSVIDQTPYVQAVGNNVTTAFPFSFLILEDIDLAVYLGSVQKVLDVDYTVSGEGVLTGGTVTFITPPGTDVVVSMIRDMARTRSTDYQNLGDFNADVVDADFDRAILISQDIHAQLNRAVRVPLSEITAFTELPPAAERADKIFVFDSAGNPDVAVSIGSTTLSRSVIGAFMFPQSAAEVAAAITPTDYSYEWGNVLRYGIEPNNVSARATNSSKLKALVNPDNSRVADVILFPNTSGNDTYYFGVTDIPIADGYLLDFQGCTIDFTGNYDAAMNLHGFLECIRNVALVNGRINVDYDGSAGSDNGLAIRVGSRIFSPFGSDADGIEDEDESELMGGCVQRDLRITSNNPGASIILMLGGLDGNECENVYINGSAVCDVGIHYEFGFWHYEATVANRKSSHATNLYFKNIKIENMKVTTPAENFSMTGAMSVMVDGLVTDGGYNGVVARPGEALYYNMGPPWVDMRPHYTYKNVVVTDTVNVGMACLGVESKAGGYLSGEAGVTEAKQTDLMSFTVDGFSVERGIQASGRSVAFRNGVVRGGNEGLWLQSECMFFDVQNVNFLDNLGNGIRTDTGGNIWAVRRFKSGSIRNCMFGGNGSFANEAAISLSDSKGVLIEACRFGYETVHDGVAETTQGSGVSNGATSIGTTVRNCYGGGITSTGSPAMYTNAGSGFWKYCKIESPQGIKTLSGQWTIDGDGVDADIGDANTTLTPGEDLPTQRYATTLTATRTVTLATGHQGAKFTIIRTGLGAFDLVVTGVKTITGAVAARIETIHDGNAWRLSDYSPL